MIIFGVIMLTGIVAFLVVAFIILVIMTLFFGCRKYEEKFSYKLMRKCFLAFDNWEYAILIYNLYAGIMGYIMFMAMPILNVYLK